MRLPVTAALIAAVLATSHVAPATAQVAGQRVALAAAPRPGAPSPAAQCRAAIGAAERTAGIPERLMQAIGVIESGRRDETGIRTAYPWTINAEGAGSYYATKAEAIAAVNALRARGVRSIDVGCMQVNMMYHSDAFASLEEAFDPPANAAYAARFLLRLFAQTGSWPGATAGYHSLTPGVGTEYARKVLAVWGQPPSRGTPAPVPTSAPMAASASPAGPSFAAQSAGAGRIIPLPGTAVVATGRGLDSYRAAPTRLAFGAVSRRG